MKLTNNTIKKTMNILEERKTVKVASVKGATRQVEEGLLDRIKKGLGMSAKAKDNDQDVETAPETVQTPEIELFNPRLKLNDVTDEHLKVAADKIQRKHLSSLKSFERFTKATMDKLSHDKEQTGKFAKLANYIYMEDYINIDHDAMERDNAKEKEREDREYRRKRDAKAQAKKDRDTDYLRNIGRI